VSADGLRAVVSEPEAVLALDLASGRVLWRFTLERWTGLLNEPPPAAIVGGLVVFVVGRNHGYELDAVDLLTGRRAWAESAFVGRDRPDLSAAALTREAATLTFPGRLISVRLSDGRRLWSRPLPTGEWKCEPTRSGEVLVTPAEATPARDMKAAWRWALGQLRAVPTANRLGRVAGGLYDAWKDRRIVWWLADAKDGREVRRYELPADGPAAWVRAGDGRAWVARRGGLVVFRAGR
jgi:outer membrane protein assembly factor BamB